jgi:hypothetical protein
MVTASGPAAVMAVRKAWRRAGDVQFRFARKGRTICCHSDGDCPPRIDTRLQVCRHCQGSRDPQAFGYAVDRRPQARLRRQGVCVGDSGIDGAVDAAMGFGVVGNDDPPQGQDNGAHTPQNPLRRAAFGGGAVFKQVAQADQAAEYLVGGLYPDDRLGSAVAGGAAGADGVHNGGSRGLDRFARGPAVDPGMGFPSGLGHPGCLNQPVQVAREFGKLAVRLGHRPSGGQERVDAPDDHGQQNRPYRAGDERRGEDGGLGRAGVAAVERQNLDGGEQTAKLLGRLSIDAGERGAEQAEHPQRQGDDRAEFAQQAKDRGNGGAGQGKGDQHRNTAADRTAGVADARQ